VEVCLSAPNVLLLVVDSLRADAFFGSDVPTPYFDAITERGASFTQCICTCTTTTPSFSSILTGCYPPKHGVRGLQGFRLNRALTTMADAFSRAGYTTYAEVTGPLLPETGILRGFDSANHRPAYKVPFFGWRDEVTQRMRSFVEPWFMLLHIWEVHRPYRSPPNFEKRKDRAGYEAALTATDEWLRLVYEATGDDAIVVITGDHGEEYPESALELQMIRVARKARRALRTSRWLPLLDRKLAGAEIGHGFALHEPLVRVPLVIAGPGVEQIRVEDQVRHVDLLPTLADLCGLEEVRGVDGRSLRPLMQGRSLEEEPAYMEAVGVKLGGQKIAGARTPDWKLIQPLGGRASLYRLGGPRGPDEKHNVYSRHPEAARRLEVIIEQTNAQTLEGEVADSGMTSEEEAIVEQHLRELGYL
jgi:arylsulfatase A-like enzyme